MIINNKLPGTIRRKPAWNRAFSYAQRFPYLYALIVLPLAATGFAYLLMFPFMVLLGLYNIANITGSVTSSEIPQYLVQLSLWLGMTALGFTTTRHLLKVRFNLPEGLDINPVTAQRLHHLLNQLKSEIKSPRIDRVIITEQVTLDIVKTPMHSLPFWSHNTLVVGLPMMQCLSPEYFRCALVRKLVQHDKHQHTLLKYLAQLRSIWMQYPRQLTISKNGRNALLYFFFKFYAPIYRFISTPLANSVELIADQETLRIINDEDLLQTIEKVIVAKIYLEKQYWPKIKKMVEQNHYSLIHPYSKLEQILQKGLTPQLSKNWLDTLYRQPYPQPGPVPDLRSRMNNVGWSKIRIPEKIQESAAHYYLDNAYTDVISEINQMWLLRRSHFHDDVPARSLRSLQQQADNVAASRISAELFN